MVDLQTSARGFSAALMDLVDEIEGDVEAVIKKACFDLYAMIVKRTPVDTGRAKGSWGIGTRYSDDVLPPGEYRNNPTAQMAGAAAGDSFTFTVKNDRVFIYNNLEYISYLESGSSGQAPAGMVAISLSEFEAHFRKALKTESVLI